MSLATSNGSEITTNDPPDLTSTENRPSAPTSDHASTQAPTNNSTGSVTIPCIGSDNVKLLRIPVRFKGIDTLALVDTGSVASLLAERVYREISDICITVKPTFKSFVSAGGHPIETCGYPSRDFRRRNSSTLSKIFRKIVSWALTSYRNMRRVSPAAGNY